MEKLIIKAKHFKKTEFTDNCNCALSKAAKEQFNTGEVSEDVNYIVIDNDIFDHEQYGYDKFDIDYEKAVSLEFSDEVIREIKLLSRIPSAAKNTK